MWTVEQPFKDRLKGLEDVKEVHFMYLSKIPAMEISHASEALQRRCVEGLKEGIGFEWGRSQQLTIEFRGT